MIGKTTDRMIRVERRSGMELPRDIRHGMYRQEKLMRSLMSNTVYTQTQCMKKQADFYQNMSRYKLSVKSSEAQ
jgi:hypothetical protein